MRNLSPSLSRRRLRRLLRVRKSLFYRMNRPHPEEARRAVSKEAATAAVGRTFFALATPLKRQQLHPLLDHHEGGAALNLLAGLDEDGDDLARHGRAPPGLPGARRAPPSRSPSGDGWRFSPQTLSYNPVRDGGTWLPPGQDIKRAPSRHIHCLRSIPKVIYGGHPLAR